MSFFTTDIIVDVMCAIAFLSDLTYNFLLLAIT